MDLLLGEPGAVRGRCADVVDADGGVVLRDLLGAEARSERIEDDGDEDASASDAGLAVAYGRIDGDALEELIRGHSLVLRPPVRSAQWYAHRRGWCLTH